jgi:hypothetical protein
VIENRRKAFEQLLQYCAKQDDILNNQAFRIFLGVPVAVTLPAAESPLAQAPVSAANNMINTPPQTKRQQATRIFDDPVEYEESGTPLDKSTFESMLKELNVERYSDGRRKICDNIAAQYMITCEQLGYIFSLLEFSSEREYAARLFAYRLIDLENEQVLYNNKFLEYESDKKYIQHTIVKAKSHEPAYNTIAL